MYLKEALRRRCQEVGMGIFRLVASDWTQRFRFESFSGNRSSALLCLVQRTSRQSRRQGPILLDVVAHRFDTVWQLLGLRSWSWKDWFANAPRRYRHMQLNTKGTLSVNRMNKQWAWVVSCGMKSIALNKVILAWLSVGRFSFLCGTRRQGVIVCIDG